MVQYCRYRLKRLFIMHCDYSAMTMVGYAGRGPPMADEYRLPVYQCAFIYTQSCKEE